MDALKRAGIVAALPFAGLCAITFTGIGVGCFVAGLPFVAVYSAGKYILNGKCVDMNKYMDTTFGIITYGIGSAPLYLLVKHMKPKAPGTVEDMKAVRAAQDQELNAVAPQP